MRKWELLEVGGRNAKVGKKEKRGAKEFEFGSSKAEKIRNRNLAVRN